MLIFSIPFVTPKSITISVSITAVPCHIIVSGLPAKLLKYSAGFIVPISPVILITKYFSTHPTTIA